MSSNDMYLYDLPYPAHDELCKLLDRDNRWEDLAGKHMKLKITTLCDLRRDDERGLSPTHQLLTFWGQQLHTVVQLFVLLSEMHHYQAMAVLEPYVHSRYHRLITEGEENIDVVFNEEGIATRNQNRPGGTGFSGENALLAPGACGASALAASESCAVPHHVISRMDENLGSHNFNMPVEGNARSLNKRVLPPMQETSEDKILNIAVLDEDNSRDKRKGNFAVPLVSVDSQSSDFLPPHFDDKMESECKKQNYPVMPPDKLPSSKTSPGSPIDVLEQTTLIPEPPLAQSPNPEENVAEAGAVYLAHEANDDCVPSFPALSIEDPVLNDGIEGAQHEDDKDSESQDGSNDTECGNQISAIGKAPLPIFR